MSITVAPSRVRFDRRSGRQSALGALVAVWVLMVIAIYLGRSDHYLSLHLGTVFLLWRVWRGGRWSLSVLRLIAIAGAGVAVAMTLAAWAGASGLALPTLWAALLFAATGLFLFGPAIRSLGRTGLLS